MSLEALKQLPVYYRIEYVSPKLYYFDRTYGDFEKVMCTFKLAGMEKTAAK